MTLPPLPDAAFDPINQLLGGVRRTLARPAALKSSVTFGLPEVRPFPVNPLHSITVSPREIGTVRFASEARRIDLMLFPAMLWRLFSYGASDPRHDEANGFRTLLADAMVEPVNGEGLERAEKLANRVRKEAKAVMDDNFDDQPNARIGMIIFFTVQIMLAEGVIELVEGSAMADALFQLYDMCDWYIVRDRHGNDRPLADQKKIEASMHKSARKFADYLKAKGYFQ